MRRSVSVAPVVAPPPRRRRSVPAAAVPALAAAVLVLLMGVRCGLAAPPVPPQCTYAALMMQLACNGDLLNATGALTGEPTTYVGAVNVTTERLREFLANEAPDPSSKCCDAAGAFNLLYCLCNNGMLKEFSECVDMEQLKEVAMFLAERCPIANPAISAYDLYMDPNCPDHPADAPVPAPEDK